MRGGFGILTAIILMVVVAIIGSMILFFAASSNQKAMDDYLKIQAEMLARSATEYAIMRIEGFDRSGGKCLQNLNISATPFDVNVTINYLFKGAAPASCTNVHATDVSDTDLNGMAIIDVIVSQRVDSANPNAFTPIIVHKRTIQKP